MQRGSDMTGVAQNGGDRRGRKHENPVNAQRNAIETATRYLVAPAGPTALLHLRDAPGDHRVFAGLWADAPAKTICRRPARAHVDARRDPATPPPAVRLTQLLRRELRPAGGRLDIGGVA